MSLLLTHEMSMKEEEKEIEKNTKKEKSIALKAST